MGTGTPKRPIPCSEVTKASGSIYSVTWGTELYLHVIKPNGEHLSTELSRKIWRDLRPMAAVPASLSFLLQHLDVILAPTKLPPASLGAHTSCWLKIHPDDPLKGVGRSLSRFPWTARIPEQKKCLGYARIQMPHWEPRANHSFLCL